MPAEAMRGRRSPAAKRAPDFCAALCKIASFAIAEGSSILLS
jgi:hypothetical protein